ncbi:uncharacterized protein [Prorops nasuta]|uniref:uncharacterized protein n=1 Tax=Prorops nasuta TaxID=863751 RepID=UPI0034D015F7
MDPVSELLEKWNFPELVPIFKEHNINENVMPHLEDNHLKELIPQIGSRVLFKEKWSNHYTTNKDFSQSSPSLSQDISPEKSNTVDNIESEYESDCGKENALVRQNNFTIKGTAILKSYKKNQFVSRSNRNVLVDIIVANALKITHRLTTDNLRDLSKKIVELFPTEDDSIYYIPPMKKHFSPSGRSIISKENVKCIANDGNDSDFVQSQDEVAETSKLWLSKNMAPFQSIILHWEKTFYLRQQLIKNSKKSLKEIIDDWPILKQPDTGHKLIEYDFERLSLTQINITIQIWDTFFENLKTLRPFKSKDDNAKALNELLLLEDIIEDTKVACQFLLLPHLISPRGRVKSGSRHWKPSISECKDSLIMFIANADEINTVIEKRINLLEEFGQTLQPFVMVIGPTIGKIISAYICVNEIMYLAENVLKAIDICFKIFFVLNIQYSPESEHIWLLIQKYIYNINSNCDKKCSLVNEILSDLKQLNKK